MALPSGAAEPNRERTPTMTLKGPAKQRACRQRKRRRTVSSMRKAQGGGRSRIEFEHAIVIDVPGCACAERTREQLDRLDMCDACANYFDL